MRGVFTRSRRTAAAWLLFVILLAPSAFAADTTNASLWAEFVVWLETHVGVAADQGGFTIWLMSRLGVPGG